MELPKEGSYFSPKDSRFEAMYAKFLMWLVYIGIATLFAMMFVTVRHAIGRYAFNNPVFGNIEICCFMLCILIFFLIGYVQMLKGHIMMGMIVDRFSVRVQAIIECAVGIIGLVFIIFTVWRTFDQGLYQITAGNVSSVLHVPNYPWLFVLTFGWATLAGTIMIQVYHAFRTAIKGVRS